MKINIFLALFFLLSMLGVVSATNIASAQTAVTYQRTDAFLLVIHELDVNADNLVKIEEMRSTLQTLFGKRLVGHSAGKKAFIIELPQDRIPVLNDEVANIATYIKGVEVKTATYSYIMEDLKK